MLEDLNLTFICSELEKYCLLCSMPSAPVFRTVHCYKPLMQIAVP